MKALTLIKKGKNKRLTCLSKRVIRKGVNDGKEQDRLDILRAKYEKDIRRAEGNLLSLRAKLAHLEEMEREAKSIQHPDAPKDYAGLGLTEAAFQAVRALFKKSTTAAGVRAPDIKREMLAKGYVPTSDGFRFTIALTVTLGRLVQSGRLKTSRVGPVSFYRPANE